MPYDDIYPYPSPAFNALRPRPLCTTHAERYCNPNVVTTITTRTRYRHRAAEQGVTLPLSEVRVRVHRHQQGGGAPAPAPEAGLDHGRGLREVHAGAGVRPAGRLRALRQADALSLPELPVRGARPVPDDGAQVPAHGMNQRVPRRQSSSYIHIYIYVSVAWSG